MARLVRKHALFGLCKRLCVLVVALMSGPIGWAQEGRDTDAEYVTRFEQRYDRVDPVPSLAEYATVERYDEQYMDDSLTKHLERLADVANDSGGYAWGLASRMISLNEMFRVTGDTNYLSANLECIRTVLVATDDKRGKTLWTGTVAPAWGSDKYAPERGRAVFAVHTGMIVYPILDCLRLAKQRPDFFETLGEEYEALLTDSLKALAFHDPQWRDGPGEGEGHYFGKDQEPVCDDKPLPGNRLSAMGRALWASWKLTGNEVHRDRALAIGRYIKNRLTLAPDGAYYWPYWLPEAPVTGPQAKEEIHGEDCSHAGLTAALPFMLAEEGHVFTAEDMQRFARTVTRGFGRLDNGVLFPAITGRADLPPSYVGSPAGWLCLARYDPEVHDRIVIFYLRYCHSPPPYDLAMLLQYAKKKGVAAKPCWTGNRLGNAG